MSEIVLIDPDELHPHEEVDPEAVDRVAAHMRESGRFETPLLVDRRTLVVLDGHHRLWACRKLGCRRVPCFCVDYLEDDSIRLESWRDDVVLTKPGVIGMGLGDDLYPKKTTRHLYTLPPFDPVPLDELLAPETA